MTLATWSVLLALAFALSADACAAALSHAARGYRGWQPAVRIGLTFGVAQGLMPLIGWLAGQAFASAIGSVDHWVAFVLLVLIGGVAIWRELSGDDDSPGADLSGWVLMGTAIATSIDAAAAGVALPSLGAPVAIACLTIGIVTFATSSVAALAGALANAHRRRVTLAGGAILIVLGCKILLEHLLLGR